ncbi:MAG: discoidin domain-containing protein, partial [Planctomycetales bacterium]
TMVTMVDRQVGEVLDLLKELSLDENTIVFFCGDNGGNDYFKDKEHPRGFHGANVNPATGVEFRGTKGTLYEGGLRIPMTVRWPGKIASGRVSDLLWYFPDVLPTVADLTGAKTPDDVDGMSILPELIGEEAAGRKQNSHEYLYWEIGTQVAIRMEDWKAVQPGAKRGWELYNLDNDLSEEKNVANDHPQILTQLRLLAAEAHDEAEEGTFFNREIHERDRRAKYGHKPVPKRGAVNSIPTEGLLDGKKLKIVRVSSESGGNQKRAINAIDGDPRTHWHTSFSPEIDKHPHELVIDLGSKRSVSGIRYLARQDGGWNGALAKCEFFVSDSADDFGESVSTTTFRKVKTSQEKPWKAVSGRYVLIRILSEVNAGPWASISELGIIGQ